MNICRDLKSKQAIYLKGILFVIILALSIFLNLTTTSMAVRVLSIASTIWAAARLYYFMFYVIEKYVDPDYRFSSITSFLKYLLKKK